MHSHKKLISVFTRGEKGRRMHDSLIYTLQESEARKEAFLGGIS